MATELCNDNCDEDDDGEFGGFEMADAPAAAEAQPLPPALQIAQIGDVSDKKADGPVTDEMFSSTQTATQRRWPISIKIDDHVIEQSYGIKVIGLASSDGTDSLATDPVPLHLNEPALPAADNSAAVELQHCQTRLLQYEQKYAELQQLHSAEMLEMHQRTREAVDSIVQHYQKLLSETVKQCEESCKLQIKEAIDRERASLTDVKQRQEEEASKLMEEQFSALTAHFDEYLTEQRLKQQEIHAELRQDERCQMEEHINTLLQEKDNSIKIAIEEAVQLERDRAKQAMSDERDRLLQLVAEERERSQNAVGLLIAEERLHLQQSTEKTMHEYKNQIEMLMSKTLQLAQEQIKTYVDEQRRDDDAARLRLLSSVDVLIDTARCQLQQLLVTPDHHTNCLSSDSAEH